MSESKEQQKRIETGPMMVALLDEMAERLLSIQEKIKKQTPEGIIEPIAPFTATGERTVIRPLFKDKFWFSITLVKETAVELHVIVNTGKSGTTAYTMGVDENVYDQDFSMALIRDVMVWTDGADCTVKIRGSR